MSQSHIILVRHGEASAGWSAHPDPGLSRQGRGQAENSGKSLINELSYYQLLSSPKKRAIETMEIMNQGDTNSFKLDPRFIEIPSGNINADKKKEWLVNIFTTPIEELPEAVGLRVLRVGVAWMYGLRMPRSMSSRGGNTSPERICITSACESGSLLAGWVASFTST